LNTRDFFIFIDKVLEYQSRHGIELKVPTLLSQVIRETIRANNPKLLNTVDKFYQLSNAKVVELICAELRPQSVLEFQQNLKRYVSFEALPPSYIPDASHFQRFYDALLRYRNIFQRTYEIMAENNAENIPPCNNKEGGLIKIFVEKIPHDFGKSVLHDYPDRRFRDLYAFLDFFYDVVQALHKSHRSARHLERHFSGTAVAARKRDMRNLQSFPSNSARRSSNTQGSWKKSSSDRNSTHHLHAIAEEDDSQSLDGDNDAVPFQRSREHPDTDMVPSSDDLSVADIPMVQNTQNARKLRTQQLFHTLDLVSWQRLSPHRQYFLSQIRYDINDYVMEMSCAQRLI
jgi:hypothetical protein